MSPEDAARKLGEEDLDDYIESGNVDLSKDFGSVEEILKNIQK